MTCQIPSCGQITHRIYSMRDLLLVITIISLLLFLHGGYNDYLFGELFGICVLFGLGKWLIGKLNLSKFGIGQSKIKLPDHIYQLAEMADHFPHHASKKNRKKTIDEIISQAIEMTEMSGDDSDTADVLDELYETLLDSDYIAQALNVAQHMPYESRKALCLSQVACKYADRGMKDKTEELFSQAVKITLSCKDGGVKAGLFLVYAEVYFDKFRKEASAIHFLQLAQQANKEPSFFQNSNSSAIKELQARIKEGKPRFFET